MALLTTTNILSPTYVAANAGGDTYTWGGAVFVHINNTNASSRTITVTAQTPCNQGFLHDLQATVPANGEIFLKPEGSYQDSGGLVHLSYSAVTGLTIAVLVV